MTTMHILCVNGQAATTAETARKRQRKGNNIEAGPELPGGFQMVLSPRLPPQSFRLQPNGSLYRYLGT